MGYLVSKDSSRKFAIIGGGYHPKAVDVTDPSNPQWADVQDADRVIMDGNYFTSTPDDRRVYITSSSRIAVAEADPTPRVVCVDTLMPPEGEGDMSMYYLSWFGGLIYVYAVNWTNSDYIDYLLILQYPEDDVPEHSKPNLLKFEAPTFQGGKLLKVISLQQGWFELKLFSSTGALVERRRVYLRKGVNLLDIGSLKPSGVYFLKIGKEGKPFKLVLLNPRE